MYLESFSKLTPIGLMYSFPLFLYDDKVSMTLKSKRSDHGNKTQAEKYCNHRRYE